MTGRAGDVAVGIEALNVFGGNAFVDVVELMRHRGLDPGRAEQLLLQDKAVALACEDPVTMAVNAAKPIVDGMSDAERDRIELLVTGTESGIDFGKSLSTYVHDLLRLNRNCRLLEIKSACYSGTAALQMAASFVLAQVSPGARALVIATDVPRFAPPGQAAALSMNWSFAEVTAGAGAAALLVSQVPRVFRLDVGASGTYAYEVMDTCRPTTTGEAGDPDIGLLSYLDCCEHSFRAYQARVPGADFGRSFDDLCFHSPFGGMVRTAHRVMMRKAAGAERAAIDPDFQRRVAPGLRYARATGNLMGASMLSALASAIDHGDTDQPRRVGCFSYGSGCCSEFFSGIIPRGAAALQRRFEIDRALGERHRLSAPEYDQVLRQASEVTFGARNVELDLAVAARHVALRGGRARLVLRRVREFHREYQWIG